MDKSSLDSFESIPSKKNAKKKHLKICIILGVIFTFFLIGYKLLIKKISVEESLSKIYESQQATIYDSKGFEGNTTYEVTVTNTKTNETYDNDQYHNDGKTYFAKNGINDELILINYDKDENQNYKYSDYSLHTNGICNSKNVNNMCFFSYDFTLDYFISDDTSFNFLNYIKKQFEKEKIKVNDKVLKEYFSIEENKDKNQNTIISIEIKQPDFFNQWLKSLENKDKYTKRKEVYTIDKHGFLKSVKTYSTYIENGLVSDVDAQIKIEQTTTKHFSNVDKNIDLKMKEPYGKYYNEA